MSEKKILEEMEALDQRIYGEMDYSMKQTLKLVRRSFARELLRKRGVSEKEISSKLGRIFNNSITIHGHEAIALQNGDNKE